MLKSFCSFYEDIILLQVWALIFKKIKESEFSQLAFTCSKSTTETLEKGAKYVQS